MPPLPRLKLQVLRELERELRFAPPDALRRDIGRVEALISDVSPETAYPDEWVVFRVTGYRREQSSKGATVGAALLADLAAFLERLCDAAGLTTTELEAAGFDTLSVEGLCGEWKVSRKTLDRWRRRGLRTSAKRGDENNKGELFHAPFLAARLSASTS